MVIASQAAISPCDVFHVSPLDWPVVASVRRLYDSHWGKVSPDVDLAGRKTIAEAFFREVMADARSHFPDAGTLRKAFRGRLRDVVFDCYYALVTAHQPPELLAKIRSSSARLLFEENVLGWKTQADFARAVGLLPSQVTRLFTYFFNPLSAELGTGLSIDKRDAAAAQVLSFGGPVGRCEFTWSARDSLLWQLGAAAGRAMADPDPATWDARREGCFRLVGENLAALGGFDGPEDLSYYAARLTALACRATPATADPAAAQLPNGFTLGFPLAVPDAVRATSLAAQLRPADPAPEHLQPLQPALDAARRRSHAFAGRWADSLSYRLAAKNLARECPRQDWPPVAIRAAATHIPVSGPCYNSRVPLPCDELAELPASVAATLPWVEFVRVEAGVEVNVFWVNAPTAECVAVIEVSLSPPTDSGEWVQLRCLDVMLRRNASYGATGGAVFTGRGTFRDLDLDQAWNRLAAADRAKWDSEKTWTEPPKEIRAVRVGCYTTAGRAGVPALDDRFKTLEREAGWRVFQSVNNLLAEWQTDSLRLCRSAIENRLDECRPSLRTDSVPPLPHRPVAEPTGVVSSAPEAQVSQVPIIFAAPRPQATQIPLTPNVRYHVATFSLDRHAQVYKPELTRNVPGTGVAPTRRDPTAPFSPEPNRDVIGAAT